ncbi:MAG: hypothetical protein OHK0037_00020 [Elainellaceae cyanobacterium]
MKKLNGSSWTTQRYLLLSKGLGEAYGCGLTTSEPTDNADEWTPEKLAHFSRNLSRAFLM